MFVILSLKVVKAVLLLSEAVLLFRHVASVDDRRCCFATDDSSSSSFDATPPVDDRRCSIIAPDSESLSKQLKSIDNPSFDNDSSSSCSPNMDKLSSSPPPAHSVLTACSSAASCNKCAILLAVTAPLSLIFCWKIRNDWFSDAADCRCRFVKLARLFTW